MAEYNPHLPDIAGNEWVPIVPSPYLMDTGVERGYSFRLTAPTTPYQGQYFLQAEPPGALVTQTPLMAIYPKGQEDTVGEIRTTVIPVDGAVLTGNGTVVGPSGSTALSALLSSSDSAAVRFDSGVAAGQLTVSFDTITAISTTLNDKRILNVSLLYTAGGDWSQIGAPTSSLFTTGITFGGDLILYGSGILDSDQTSLSETIPTLSRISLGEMNLNALARARDTNSVYPWRSPEMVNWDASSVTPMRFQFNWNNLPASTFNPLRLNYLAMEVTYCEETRVRYGGTKLGPQYAMTGNEATYAVPTQNTVVLRTASTLATGSALAAGDYTITSCMGDMGDLFVNFFGITAFASSTVAPTAQANRQLYAMPGAILDGVVIDRALTVNERIDSEQSDVLPYIAYNLAFNAISDAPTHAYGKQHTAPVYTGHNIEQNFNFSTLRATPYPWLRFYARRFGTCTANLVATLASNAGEFATLTCAAFDALPEIADGWKEVTLPVTAPATLTTGNDTLVWSSTTSAGSQWQILGSKGQVSNLTSSFQTSSQALEDPAGTTFISDDASFYFMQDPPTVVGLATFNTTSSLNGVGLECGSPAHCIPTGMPLVVITWTSITTSSPAASGTFGSYQVERQDDADSTWQRIANFTSISRAFLFDVESRFGMASRYRIRVANTYNVTGPWSATVSATMPAIDPSVWAFTSNHLNTSIFMAPQVGPQAPDFEPTFPEGDAVTLQEMYNRDFVNAFHGSERGGDRFPLVLLANQGVVSLPRLDRLFTTFRDLAWADIPYVCVRSGEGDRWYANVQVPSGNIRSRRTGNKVQLVSVRVIETLELPTPYEG
jgi:hypothetical protein